ncbi:MAG: hypothetical protein ABIT38_03845 [Gemmatimonadaceae bacterium]
MRLADLHGSVLVATSYDADTQEWVFAFTHDITLRVAAAWRVVGPEGISIGWQDDGQWFGLAAPARVTDRVQRSCGGEVRRATSEVGTGDLRIAFAAGGELQVFNDSCGYEGWVLRGPGGSWIVGQGGGNVSRSPSDG